LQRYIAVAHGQTAAAAALLQGGAGLEAVDPFTGRAGWIGFGYHFSPRTLLLCVKTPIN
jgi:hypothetical protein